MVAPGAPGAAGARRGGRTPRGLATIAVALATVACRPSPRAGWLEHEPGTSRAGPRRPPPDAATAAGEVEAARAAGDAGRLVIAVVRLAAAGGDVSGLRTELLAAVDRAPAAALEAAAAVMEPGRAPAGAVAARLAALAVHRGEAVAAARWLEVARAAPDGGELTATLDAVAAALAAAGPVDPALVAVLLPLSGRHARVGAELRLAIELAPAAGARRVFLDTGGDPDGAAAAVDRAAAEGAIAVLGPVGLREAEAAARRAARRGLPIALLAPGDGADPDAGVFRLAGSPEAEARAAAAIAVALGTPTAGVLAPRDDVGVAAAQAFAEAATAAGVEVTARGGYDPTATDLEPDVKDFLGLDPAINPRLAAHLRRHGKRGWQTFSPDVPFALLYLPDRHDRAAIVASFLPYLGVELRTADFLTPDYLRRKHGGRIPQVVQLLGSSGWNHPGLVTRGGNAVEGAYLVEPCPGALGEAAAAELVARFAARAGREPSTAAQEAHDAWRLLAAARTAAAARARPGDDLRAALVTALRRATLDDGACGAARVGADGQLEREPVLLGVDAGEIVVVPY